MASEWDAFLSYRTPRARGRADALQARGAVRSAVDPAGRVAVVLETRAGRTAFVGRRGAGLSLLVRSLPGLVVDPVRSFGFAWSVTFDPPSRGISARTGR